MHTIDIAIIPRRERITDGFAVQSIRLIIDNLEKSFTDADEESRTNMAYASLLAGLAFALPKTAACHACSFPLSANYHLPHGEACALTLDSLMLLNNSPRLEELSKLAGMESTQKLADYIKHLKEISGLCTTLSSLGDVDIEMLAKESAKHPLMANNPVKLSEDDLINMFEKLK